MSELTGRIDRAIKAVVPSILGVSIGDPANKATWRVQPASLQAAAQPTIDAFNPNDPAILAAERDAMITSEAARDIIRAMLLFYLRDKLGRNPTIAERDAARTAFVQAFRDVT